MIIFYKHFYLQNLYEMILYCKSTQGCHWTDYFFFGAAFLAAFLAGFFLGAAFFFGAAFFAAGFFAFLALGFLAFGFLAFLTFFAAFFFGFLAFLAAFGFSASLKHPAPFPLALPGTNFLAVTILLTASLTLF